MSKRIDTGSRRMPATSYKRAVELINAETERAAKRGTVRPAELYVCFRNGFEVHMPYSSGYDMWSDLGESIYVLPSVGKRLFENGYAVLPDGDTMEEALEHLAFTSKPLPIGFIAAYGGYAIGESYNAARIMCEEFLADGERAGKTPSLGLVPMKPGPGYELMGWGGTYAIDSVYITEEVAQLLIADGLISSDT